MEAARPAAADNVHGRFPAVTIPAGIRRRKKEGAPNNRPVTGCRKQPMTTRTESVAADHSRSHTGAMNFYRGSPGRGFLSGSRYQNRMPGQYPLSVP